MLTLNRSVRSHKEHIVACQLQNLQDEMRAIEEDGRVNMERLKAEADALQARFGRYEELEERAGLSSEQEDFLRVSEEGLALLQA